MPLNIMDVPIIKEFWAKGKEEGRSLGKAEGLAEGLAEGMAEGLAEGRAEGKAEGKAEGMAELVLHLMTSKFGPVPQWAREQLAQASTDQLIGWADAVQRAQALEDIFRPPSHP